MTYLKRRTPAVIATFGVVLALVRCTIPEYTVDDSMGRDVQGDASTTGGTPTAGDSGQGGVGGPGAANPLGGTSGAAGNSVAPGGSTSAAGVAGALVSGTGGRPNGGNSGTAGAGGMAGAAGMAGGGEGGGYGGGSVSPGDTGGTMNTAGSGGLGQQGTGGGVSGTAGVSSGGSPATGGSAGQVSTGGVPASGGSVATGGVAPSGGSSATGGSMATGGVPLTGGAGPTGGVLSTGGIAAAGGVPSTGGASGGTGATVPTGGTPSTGGTVVSGGGASGTAGVSGAGGGPGSCTPTDTRSCADGGYLGACASGVQTCLPGGNWGACDIEPAPMDSCTVSGDDSTCDGLRNGGCVCIVGDTRSCALGGALGNCAAGQQTCQAATTWGPCSISALPNDSCLQSGDDSNCNGVANDGCDCILGATRSCEQGGLHGKCAGGEQTCDASGHYGACSVTPSSSDTCALNNDDNCNGNVNEGCPCTESQMRPCTQGGYFGKCAGGTQTCNALGQWGVCSIVPASDDTCASGNDDNCNGTPNDGCLCVLDQARACGACNEGLQLCTDGRAGTYGSCIGAIPLVTYYRDADGDGHATNVSVSLCGSAPAGYISGPVDDCCDWDVQAYPGQTSYFVRQVDSRCGGGWDFDCSDGTVELQYANVATGDRCLYMDRAYACSPQSGWVLPSAAACGVTANWAEPVCEYMDGSSVCSGYVTKTQACK
jgi:hypothetical protein